MGSENHCITVELVPEVGSEIGLVRVGDDVSVTLRSGSGGQPTEQRAETR